MDTFWPHTVWYLCILFERLLNPMLIEGVLIFLILCFRKTWYIRNILWKPNVHKTAVNSKDVPVGPRARPPSKRKDHPYLRGLIRGWDDLRYLVMEFWSTHNTSPRQQRYTFHTVGCQVKCFSNAVFSLCSGAVRRRRLRLYPQFKNRV